MPSPLVNSFRCLHVLFVVLCYTDFELRRFQIHFGPVLISCLYVLSKWLVDMAAWNIVQHSNMVIKSFHVAIVVSKLVIDLPFEWFILML